MEEPRPREGIVRRVSRKSKRVSVNNLHLPPYPSEESLSRFTRWRIAHPYLSTAITIVLLACLTVVYRLYLGKSFLDALSGAIPTVLGTTLSSLVITRHWHRMYRRPYRRDD